MKILEKDENVDKKIVGFIENSLFTTLTNVNFFITGIDIQHIPP